MRHGSLFSGIGGFDLAAEWMGWENVFHCEWMEFPRKVLEYYWPDADSHIDICKTDFKKYEGTIDIISGGFPCQPFSLAGKRKGTDDERYLWGEMLRAIQEIKPKFVIAENVYGITNIDDGLVFEQVCIDLETEGYEVQPFVIPACAKNAPHRRDRVWFVATNTKCKGLEGHDRERQGLSIHRSNQGILFGTENKLTSTNPNSNRLQGGISTDLDKQARSKKSTFKECISLYKHEISFQEFPTQSPVCGGDDGIPPELDGITFSKWRTESLKAYGNAIVPQVAYQIFKELL